MEEKQIERIMHEHLNRWDPESLVEIGKPQTKYKQEVKDILDSLDSIRCSEELAQLLCDTLNKRLNYPVYEMYQCLPVATQIWEDLLHIQRKSSS